MKCPDCEEDLAMNAKSCPCNWVKKENPGQPKIDFASREIYKGGVLSSEAFNDQFNALCVAYPADERLMSSKIKDGWWKALKDVETDDFVSGIILARQESSYRVPTLPMLEKCIGISVKRRAKSDLEDRIAEHAKRKTQPTAYNPMDLKDPKLKEISKDILKVITQSGISPSAWRRLGKKYHDVPNPSERGAKFGSFFEELAVSLENFIAKKG